jgi:hypothetical protein
MNRILPALAFVVLAGFLGVLLVAVPRLDLGAVILLTLVLAGRDLFGAVFGRRNS